MHYIIFLFLATLGIALYAIGVISKRASLVILALIINAGNILAPWTVELPVGHITYNESNSTTEMFRTVYIYDYLDTTTKIVLSLVFLALFIMCLYVILYYTFKVPEEEAEL